MLRIIAGKYRHRLIKIPSSKTTRPTIDRMREANFSSIHFEIENKIFLDLFAGSGANPIEAVSRGALKSIAVEKDHEAFKILKQNVQLLGIENMDLYNMDALDFLERKKGIEVDFIYLDPPFKDVALLNECLEKIAKYKMLEKNGKIIIETLVEANIKIPKNFVIVKSKKYNQKVCHFVYHNN
ncbi:DNA METHYLASE [Mycoplasmopsis pulmonis]|uniref:DNA METHYLASE n=1 Tax=Mycoplasmopsis pulmonis (strain UAB CTIP) TaxID=272635 RepID=Q98PN4_MYCPU|nr:16S rRNA (guanine(966)-N(2))-methyltransferase RsmD [Mycoplasmopsis pulmonis]CAC13861.1 DNA METHYLASE [Mycoplasmopsis pulmonis]